MDRGVVVSAMNGAVLARIKRRDDSSVGVKFVGTPFVLAESCATPTETPSKSTASIWRPWTGTRGTKANPVEGQHTLYAFLTTEPNGVVKPVHSKAMPVMLTTPEEFDDWLGGEVEDVLAMQAPLPDEALRIVANGRQEGWIAGS